MAVDTSSPPAATYSVVGMSAAGFADHHRDTDPRYTRCRHLHAYPTLQEQRHRRPSVL